MWRRAYLFLLLVRLYFAFSPSYLHPDEVFQGPEVIAGRVLSYPARIPWEFTSAKPIRSVLPLWLFYGSPMIILHWLWDGIGQNGVPSEIVYWTLRVVMFILSFVFEDWALYELLQSPRQRRLAVLLVSSSYVTWTFQTHTFSNSIETVLLLWSLALIQRLTQLRGKSGLLRPAVLAMLLVLGTFNRVNFPAFLIPSAPQLLYHLFHHPMTACVLIGVGLSFTCLAIAVDTAFYSSQSFSFSTIFTHPIITPLNNLIYNSSSKNLAQHGLHPYYQHFLVNLPQLLGPAYLLIFISPRRSRLLAAALLGTLVLSFAPHQEPRFLLPTVPLILSSIRMPRRFSRLWVVAWIVFNTLMGILMGVFHQGGVVPAQLHLSKTQHVSQAFWWKTYSPPTWLLDGAAEANVTRDMMGMHELDILEELRKAAVCSSPPAIPNSRQSRGESNIQNSNNETVLGDVYLVAPRSALALDQYLVVSKGEGDEEEISLREEWSYRHHFNLDDMDFAEDGIWKTLKRVVGRRGLVIWRVLKDCQKHRS